MRKKLLLVFFLVAVLTVVLVHMMSRPAQQVESNSAPSENQIRIAMLQLKSYGADLEENLSIGEKYCREAKQKGADIILFPEMWSIGYTRYNWPGSGFTPDRYPLDFSTWRNRAVGPQDGFIRHFQDLARELQVVIVLTYLEQWDPLPRNSATIITAEGKLLMSYAKVHTSDMKATESNCTPGDDFYVCDLPVRDQVVKTGIMICFDREHPESARILMLKGAELILTPNACTLDDRRINQFQSRAFENAVAVAMTNYASPSQNGRSCAFDGSGNEIIVAGGEEGIVLADIDLADLRKHRQKTSWGNAYRRPKKYDALSSLDVDSIFIRNNGLGEIFDRESR